MTGARIDVGGVPTYYDVRGSGPKPLLLLHGGFQVIDTISQVADWLSPEFKVYLPERRGHGRTPDVEGPITFELMAASTDARRPWWRCHTSTARRSITPSSLAQATS